MKYMSNLTVGSHLIKFIVDGEFRCSKDLPITTDSFGFKNNILEIVIDEEE